MTLERTYCSPGLTVLPCGSLLVVLLRGGELRASSPLIGNKTPGGEAAGATPLSQIVANPAKKAKQSHRWEERVS